MKLFRVMITTVAVVAAESSCEAHTIASTEAGRIMMDDINPEIDVMDEVTSADDLDHGWTDDCIPYGSMETIASILNK